MSKVEKLSNLVQYGGLQIFSGQILSRIQVITGKEQGRIEECRVITPKAISSEGEIDDTLVEQEKKHFIVPSMDKLSKEGDIVIKLSTPFDSATITKNLVGCIIPSFCAIIRNDPNKSIVTTDYLQAFLNSDVCKRQLESKVLGVAMTILSIGKIKDIEIPIPSKTMQEEIGQAYRKVQEKNRVLKQILDLEKKKSEILFRELMQ